MPANIRLLLRAIALVFLCALATGCVDEGLSRTDTQSSAEADAEQWYRNGEYERAGHAFIALADAHRDARDRYRLRAAEAFREEGDLDAVATALEGVQMRHLTRDEQTRVDVLQAEVALSKHDSARALTLLTIPDKDLTRPQRLRVLELRARAQASAGDAFGSARTRATLGILLEGKDRSQNAHQIVATLAQLDPEFAQAAGGIDAAERSAAPVRRRGARARRVSRRRSRIRISPSARSMSRIAPGGEGYRPARVIALLLPVGGQLRGVAQAIRDGFFAGLFSDTHLPRPEVRVYDSGANEADAVASYQRAVNEGADHVVGPLRRDAVSAVFAQAKLPVPVLALNQPEHGEPRTGGQRRVRPHTRHRGHAGRAAHDRPRHHARRNHHREHRLGRTCRYGVSCAIRSPAWGDRR